MEKKTKKPDTPPIQSKEDSPTKGAYQEKAPVWCILFFCVFLLTTLKWTTIGRDTGEFLNGYLLAMLAWLIATLQAKYTKLPEKKESKKTPNP